MKRIWKRGLAFLLAMCLLAQPLTALAQWDGLTARKIPSYQGHNQRASISGNDLIKAFQLEEGESSVMPVESFTYQNASGDTISCTPLIQEKQADFRSPVPFLMSDEKGRKGKVWIMVRPAEDWTEEEEQAWLDTAPEWIRVRDRLIALLEKLNQLVEKKEVQIGDYHSAYQPMVEYLRKYDFWSMVDGSENPAFGQDEVLYTEETLRALMEKQLTDKKKLFKADQTLAILGCIEEFIDEIENNRIAAPELTGFQLGPYKGVVDGENTVTLTLPEDATVPDPSEAIVTTAGGVYANYFAGSLETGQLLYRLTPWAERTGTLYNGKGGYGFYTDLGKTWLVRVERGEPVLKLQDFAVTLGARTWHGRIDEEKRLVTMTLPEGTDLTALVPELTHTAEKAELNGLPEGSAVDLSKPAELTLTLDDKYRVSYQVQITTGPSAECEILSYQVAGQAGFLSGDTISLTLPWGTPVEELSAEIAISPDAVLVEQPERLAYDTPLTYVVQAQNGDRRTYTVTLKETPVSQENQILSFSYGSIEGVIDENAGTVQLEVPYGTDLKQLKPTIRVSPFASVYPASEEAQDFSGSEPVPYTVTAQSGVTNTYQVTVTLGAAGENTYKKEMERLRDNIISRYRKEAADDWEWMNVGFYDGTTRAPGPDALPEGLNLHSRIRKLDIQSNVAMTDLARTIMMLTALGVDCTKLDQYTTPDQPFLDARGEEVKDLTAVLYNYAGGYTINGPIFALIALDMGNYTIPDNARWTRAQLLETMLTHKYGTDGFGVDMVGMLMQSIAPYADDPVYGERVRAKLEQGINLFLGKEQAPSVDPMAKDFTFGGFGTQNSESAAQAICALSAAGIDCHTDPRFQDGKGASVLTAFLDYADGEYFYHTKGGPPKNAMATYQGCYAVQWYLEFLEHGGGGNPYSLYYHQQDFSRALSTEAEIRSFTLEGKEGVIAGDQITVTLPKGTPLQRLRPELILSDYATLIAPELPTTFVENASTPFTVQAEDGVTTKTYYVTVQLSEGLESSGASLDPESLTLQDAKILRDLEITGRKVTEEEGVTDILLSVGPGVDTTALLLKGAISYGAVTEPAGILDGETEVNLSGWNTITVISQDKKTEKVYRIKAEAKESASIEAFSVVIDGTEYKGVIDNQKDTIQVKNVPKDADVTALAPEIVLGPGTETCSPLPGIAQDFTKTDGVKYTVTGSGLATRTYTVTVLDADGQIPSGGNKNPGGSDPEQPTIASAKILGFSLYGEEAVIDHGSGSIWLTLPEGTDVSQAAPQVLVGNGCRVSPVSGEVVDLRSPVVYTVTNGEETAHYTVTVTLEKSLSQELWEEMEEYSTVTDHQVSRE